MHLVLIFGMQRCTYNPTILLLTNFLKENEGNSSHVILDFILNSKITKTAKSLHKNHTYKIKWTIRYQSYENFSLLKTPSIPYFFKKKPGVLKIIISTPHLENKIIPNQSNNRTQLHKVLNRFSIGYISIIMLNISFFPPLRAIQLRPTADKVKMLVRDRSDGFVLQTHDDSFTQKLWIRRQALQGQEALKRTQ